MRSMPVRTGANLWARACREAGVESLTLHAFITLARRGGARVEVVERTTHNAAGTIVDHYTEWDGGSRYFQTKESSEPSLKH